MYKELLVPYQTDNSFMKPQPPATSRQILEAENVLGVSFPEELRQLLLEMNGDKWLFLSIKEIITDNLMLWEELSEIYENIREFLMIGTNGCGDYYAYKISEGKIIDTQLVRWEHEDNSSCFVATDLKELIRRYYENEI